MVADELFSVIAERTRRDILGALADEQKAVGQLVDELGVSQPTVSKHLRVLREAGVVNIRAQGQKRYYSINTEPLAEVAQWLGSIGATASTVALKSAEVQSTKPTATAAPELASQTSGMSTRASSSGALSSAGLGVAASASKSYANNGSSSSSASKSAAVNGLSPVQSARPAALTNAEVVVSTQDGAEGKVQQQITRSVGRAANKAADLLSSLPTFRRRKD